MNYSGIRNFDIADGIGIRVTLFVSGCTNHCPGCFQPETWDFGHGEPFTKATEDKLIDMLAPGYISGLTLLGGEPFEPSNQRGLLAFVRRVKETYPNKDIWAFTGFLYEDLLTDGSHPRCEVTDELLGMVDILVDGRFEEEKKNISLSFRGSENQRIIDLNETRKTGQLVVLDI